MLDQFPEILSAPSETPQPLCSPFYGQRKPLEQKGSRLRYVSDLLALGRTTIEESRSLLHLAKEDMGFGKLGICGLSMGGVHASMVGSLHPDPIAVTPLLAPHSAAVAFCEGVLSFNTAWDALAKDKTLSETLASRANSPPSPVSAEPPEPETRKLNPVFSHPVAHAPHFPSSSNSVETLKPSNIGTGLAIECSSPLVDDFQRQSGEPQTPNPESQTLNLRDELANEEAASVAVAAVAAGYSLEETRARLQEVLSLTDVTRFPCPKRSEAVILVAATNDAYIPQHSVERLQTAWPGMEVRWVVGGHVSSYLLHGKAFRQAILDSLARV